MQIHDKQFLLIKIVCQNVESRKMQHTSQRKYIMYNTRTRLLLAAVKRDGNTDAAVLICSVRERWNVSLRGVRAAT